MRLILETFVCFFLATLLGFLTRWPSGYNFSIPSKSSFSSSSFHGSFLNKNGPISFQYWKHVDNFGVSDVFPKLRHRIPRSDSALLFECAISVRREDALGWIDSDGMPWMKPEVSVPFNHSLFERWILTQRNVQEIIDHWNRYEMIGIVWNPYVRFVAAYEKMKVALAEKEKTFPFLQLCDNPFRACTEGWDSNTCTAMYRSFPSFFRAQFLCTHTAEYHFALDAVIDASKATDEFSANLLKTVGKKNEQFLMEMLERVKEQYEVMEKKAEMLYQIYPSCLDKVYALYHADFLLLGYPQMLVS